MKHSILGQAVTVDFTVLEFIAVLRKRELPSQSIAIDTDGLRRKRYRFFGGKDIVEKVLDTLINGTEMRVQEPRLFTVDAKQVTG
jgi:hypothetical protein